MKQQLEVQIEVSVMSSFDPLVMKVEKKLQRAGFLITNRVRSKTRTRITGLMSVKRRFA